MPEFKYASEDGSFALVNAETKEHPVPVDTNGKRMKLNEELYDENEELAEAAEEVPPFDVAQIEADGVALQAGIDKLVGLGLTEEEAKLIAG